MTLQKEKVRVRIAPSPTGELHIGTARTALFNWLYAKQNHGKFILRIEDTDALRSKQEFIESIKESLTWLGLEWDEEYLQSENLNNHSSLLKDLLSNGLIFYCPHKGVEYKRNGQPHVCDKRDGSEKEGILRFKNDEKDNIIFNDIIRGEISAPAETLGDFSVAINLSKPLFIFASTVDDSQMNISHVIRGEDHISNTHKQILLQKALGYYAPLYAHIPLTLSLNKSKLSKRHGAVSVLEYKNSGYLKESLINFMALLGWHPATDREVLSSDELIKEFDITRMQKGGAVFNTEKLNWLNKHYINKLSDEKLALMLIPYLIKSGLIIPAPKNITSVSRSAVSRPVESYKAKNGSEINISYLKNIAQVEKPRLTTLADISQNADFFFKNPVYDRSLLSWKGRQRDNEIVNKLDMIYNILSDIKPSKFDLKSLSTLIMPIAEKEGRGELLWPLRAALSGKKASPGPFEIMDIIGKNESLARIEQAIKALS